MMCFFAAPVMPPQSMLLYDVNVTSATLSMDAWETGGCSITSFDVDLQVMGDNVWKNVQRSISPNIVRTLWSVRFVSDIKLYFWYKHNVMNNCSMLCCTFNTLMLFIIVREYRNTSWRQLTSLCVARVTTTGKLLLKCLLDLESPVLQCIKRCNISGQYFSDLILQTWLRKSDRVQSGVSRSCWKTSHVMTSYKVLTSTSQSKYSRYNQAMLSPV